jgi:hypothetical protein
MKGQAKLILRLIAILSVFIEEKIIACVNVLILAIRMSTNTWRSVVVKALGIGMAK